VSTFPSDALKLAERLLAAGFSAQQADALARAIVETHTELATKRDLDVALTCEIDPLKADLLLLKCLSGLILVGILVLGVLLWS
jgi:hypothetical protein